MSKKTIGVYTATCPRPQHVEMLKQFANGIKHIEGDKAKVFLTNDQHFTFADATILNGAPKPHANDLTHTSPGKIRDHIVAGCQMSNTNFIMTEVPLIGRTFTADWPYYRVGVNHYLNNYGDFNFPENPGNERWSRIQKKLNIKVRPWRKNGNHIVIALVRTRNWNLFGVDMFQWVVDSVKKIREVSDRPIVIRRHPLQKKSEVEIKAYSYIDQELNQYKDISYDEEGGSPEKILTNAWAAVVLTSGFSTDSLLLGIPTIVCHKSNFAWENVGHDVSEIEDPFMTDRLHYFRRISYCHWTVNEMQNGKVWKHLRGGLNLDA